MRKRAILCGAAVFGLATSAQAAIYQTLSPYTDAVGDALGSTAGARDIAGATITNDATNLYITIELDPTAQTNAQGNPETPANILTNGINYAIAITTGAGAGGDTMANATTHGNPYGRAISIDSSLGGMTDWIGIFGAGGSGSGTSPYTSFGFNDYVFGTPTSTSPAGKWTEIEDVLSGEPYGFAGGDVTANTISLTVPMSDFADNLALTPGTTIDFDIYTTGGSGAQTAYDSLADQSPTQTPSSYVATNQYNSTVLDSYTIAAPVPEPAMLGLLSCGGLLLLKRRSKT